MIELKGCAVDGAAEVVATLRDTPQSLLYRFQGLAKQAAQMADDDLTQAVSGGALGRKSGVLGSTVRHGVTEPEQGRVMAWAGFPSRLEPLIAFHDQGFQGQFPIRRYRRMGWKAFGTPYSPRKHWVMGHERRVSKPGLHFLAPAAERAEAWLRDQATEITP